MEENIREYKRMAERVITRQRPNKNIYNSYVCMRESMDIDFIKHHEWYLFRFFRTKANTLTDEHTKHCFKLRR